jgi:hypothetical protein
LCCHLKKLQYNEYETYKDKWISNESQNLYCFSYQGPSNAGAEDGNEELTPVDIDFNLMQSFLDPFFSQQGLPGPASNLLGLMGVKVPPPNNYISNFVSFFFPFH